MYSTDNFEQKYSVQDMNSEIRDSIGMNRMKKWNLQVIISERVVR